MVVRQHGLPDSIVTNRGFFFTSKFWSLLYYFVDIKWRLFTSFHLQIDGQTERQNSTMEAFLQAFVNFEQNDWARLLPMAKFAYTNAKNSSISHTPSKLNCGYHPCVSFKENADPRSQSKSVDMLSAKLQDLMTVCQENLHHTQKLQKQAHNKSVKPRSYAPDDKVWLNSKYIKTKCNQKLEAKFFVPFQVLHSIEKQVYKLELPKRCRMHNVFHVSRLEHDTTKKEWVDERMTELELKAGNSKEYEVETIWNSAVYANKLESSQLQGLYYLVAWKDYSEEDNTWEPLSVVQHLKKLISCFYKEHPEKLTATSPPIDSTPPMARPTVRPIRLK